MPLSLAPDRENSEKFGKTSGTGELVHVDRIGWWNCASAARSVDLSVVSYLV